MAHLPPLHNGHTAAAQQVRAGCCPATVAHLVRRHHTQVNIPLWVLVLTRCMLLLQALLWSI